MTGLIPMIPSRVPALPLSSRSRGTAERAVTLSPVVDMTHVEDMLPATRCRARRRETNQLVRLV